MKHMSKDMQACINECLRCYQTYLSRAMTHCLETGGKHVEPAHFRLMMHLGALHAAELAAP